MGSLVRPLKLVAPGLSGIAQRSLVGTLRLGFLAVRRLGRGRESGRITAIAGRLASRGGQVVFRLNGGGLLAVDASDQYWIRHAVFDRSYESDVDQLLSRVLGRGDGFVDCGANVGLWSIAASQVIDVPGRVVAVESSGATFRKLQSNWRRNGERFTICRRALWDRDDETVTFYSSDADPASASALPELAPRDAQAETVRTVALRSLVDSVRAQVDDGSDGEPIIIVKLDVEGLESRLIATLDSSLDDDVLVIYEDHGRDRAHSTTASALGKGFAVAFLGSDTMYPITAASLSELDRLKSVPSVGFNLVAGVEGGRAWRRLSEAYSDGHS